MGCAQFAVGCGVAGTAVWLGFVVQWRAAWLGRLPGVGAASGGGVALLVVRSR